MIDQMPSSTDNWVNGFIVVRKPQFNRDPEGRGAFSSTVPCLGGICYAGIDRMSWFEIDDVYYGYYTNALPEHIQALRRLIQEDARDFTCIYLCKDIAASVDILRYSNTIRPENELIAVRSDKLSSIKGTVEFDMSRAEWLGYDIVALADWSLLADGLFQIPSVFPGWVEQLNGNGLFSSPEKALEFGTVYLEASRRGEAEEFGEDLPVDEYGIEAIEIGRVKVAG